MSSIQQQEKEQTLNCETCKIDIIRDSEEHNNCIIDNSGEKIYCRNCVDYCEEEIDLSKYKNVIETDKIIYG